MEEGFRLSTFYSERERGGEEGETDTEKEKKREDGVLFKV